MSGLMTGRARRPARLQSVWMVILSALVVPALAACGDDPPAEPTACEIAAQAGQSGCVLGTGSAVYAELAQDAELEVIQGLQGGFHVWGSIRVTGFNPGTDAPNATDHPTVTFTLSFADGAQLSQVTLVRALKVRSDGQIELVGEVVPLTIGTIDEVVFQDAIFDVSVTDTCGNTATDQRRVQLVPGN